MCRACSTNSNPFSSHQARYGPMISQLSNRTLLTTLQQTTKTTFNWAQGMLLIQLTYIEWIYLLLVLISWDKAFFFSLNFGIACLTRKDRRQVEPGKSSCWTPQTGHHTASGTWHSWRAWQPLETKMDLWTRKHSVNLSNQYLCLGWG